jgi:Mor family transcriptional regulator
MKYIKAEMILPDKLLREIQNYVQGEYIYIPSELQKRKRWGEKSGSRIYIEKRNCEIRNKYRNGHKIENLSEQFFLSVESIKKIIYKKNK